MDHRQFNGEGLVDTLKKIIGTRIKALRKHRSLTQEALAEAMSCETATIGRYERGEFSPSVEQIAKMADVLGVSPAEIIPSSYEISRQELVDLREKLFTVALCIDNPAKLRVILDLAESSDK
ncbi:hypothetical protein ALQ97_200107 [Pseudomonas savastanoi pv. glycinea]|nr:hypothetical protein ALQ97_200107 [Pseudomonas savastanoi pv. glycinea]